MRQRSAGILLFRFNKEDIPEVLLVHPGGPFWANKDRGSWSVPKGEFKDEDPLEAARRELEEETGIKVSGVFIELTPVKQKAGKLIYAWALQADVDTASVISNNFELEWPPKSGSIKIFPEIDKASWFTLHDAKQKIHGGQIPLIVQLEDKLFLK